MKYEIGEIVVDKRTGEMARVFDYGWMDATSLNMEYDVVAVKTIDFGLELWSCENIRSFQEEVSVEKEDILIKK